MTQAQKKFLKGKLYELDLSDLRIDESQPRKYIDEESLRELTSSIEKHGVLEPILVRHAAEGGFCIVSGERRYRAAMRAGLTSIPAIITDGTESLLREDVTTAEDADIFPGTVGTHQYNVRKLSNGMGKTPSPAGEGVSGAEEMKDECRRSRKESKRILLEISTQATHSKMQALYGKFRVRRSGADLKSRKRAGNLQAVDINFVRRFTQKIDLLQVGSLDQEQADSLMADLDGLKRILGKKLRTEKMQPHKE